MTVVLSGLDLEGMRALVEDMGEPGFRAAQIFGWIYRQLVSDTRGMTNLPRPFRERLAAETAVSTVSVADILTAADGTAKLLLDLDDGALVEAVIMRQEYRRTLCVSTQVGCRWRCAFCASGADGFGRSLEVHELSGQVLEASKLMARRGQKLQNLVVMGMGEPLDDPRVLVRFLRIMGERVGMGMSPRRFTVSTVGIVPGIDYLAGEAMPLTLAVSLHAPNDHLRDRLVPANREYPVGEVVDACRRYFRITGRRVTFEYVMIEGVNDLPELARELATLLGNMPSHVNLIPLNPVRGLDWRPSRPARVDEFSRILSRLGPYSVTVRRSQGQDILGACGQLRRIRLAGEGRER